MVVGCFRPDWSLCYFRAAVDWPAILQADQRFSVEARYRDCTNVTSGQLVTARVRDAICDSIRDARRGRPRPPDAENPADLPLFVALYRDRCSLYRDMAGDSLHRRGYRSAMHKASLNEAAAAGLLTLAGWPSADTVLADPMCGSGTILIEAALMSLGRAPGLSRRHWPFERWPDFSRRMWRECSTAAEERQEATASTSARLFGNDLHPSALGLAQRDADAAGVAELISFSEGNCRDWDLSITPSLVVTNPPWGHRLGREAPNDLQFESPPTAGAQFEIPALQDSWRDLGAFLKRSCRGADIFVLTGDQALASNLSMKSSHRRSLSVGGVECKVLQYNVFPKKQYT